MIVLQSTWITFHFKPLLSLKSLYPQAMKLPATFVLFVSLFVLSCSQNSTLCIDPLGWPIVTLSENSDWRDCGSGRGDHWFHTCLVFVFLSLSFLVQIIPFCVLIHSAGPQSVRPSVRPHFSKSLKNKTNFKWKQ